MLLVDYIGRNSCEMVNEYVRRVNHLFRRAAAGIGANRQDYYGGGYGHPPPVFNAYGQPIGGYGHPHMGMAHHPGSAEMLPPNVQMRLDHLVSTGFCYPADIDDRSEGVTFL